MPTIALTEKETAIREKLIKAATAGQIVYYSDLADDSNAISPKEIGVILEKIAQYDIENGQPILSSIVVAKSTGLPSEGFFELCDTLDIDIYLSDLQKQCFEYWGR